MIFIIKGFRTIAFIFIVISTMFWPICSPAFFSNNTGILNTCNQLWLTESEQATPVDSIKDVVRSSV